MKGAAKEKRVELLFEVGCEEIPAGMLPKAEEELRTNIEKLIAAENLSEGVSVETFSAPRRLVAWVRGLLAKQADVEMEVTGPPKSVAYDSVGAPTRAALSFAEKQRVHVNELYLVKTPKGEYLAAKQIKLGRTAEQILVAQQFKWSLRLVVTDDLGKLSRVIFRNRGIERSRANADTL